MLFQNILNFHIFNWFINDVGTARVNLANFKSLQRRSLVLKNQNLRSSATHRSTV